MEIKIPDPGPVKEAIDHMPVKPPYLWVTGLVLSALTLIFRSSSTGLGIAAAGAFIAAAWIESTIMAAFLKRPPAAGGPDMSSPPIPPPPENNPPSTPAPPHSPPQGIELEPAPPPKPDGPDANNPH